MNGTMRNVQLEVAKCLRGFSVLDKFAIFESEFGSLENFREKRFNEAAGASIFTFRPLPIKLIENIDLPCFEQIGFDIIISKPISSAVVLDLLSTAEAVGEFLPRNKFNNDMWAASFTLSKSNPWRELQSNTFHRVRMSFVSTMWSQSHL